MEQQGVGFDRFPSAAVTQIQNLSKGEMNDAPKVRSLT